MTKLGYRTLCLLLIFGCSTTLFCVRYTLQQKYFHNDLNSMYQSKPLIKYTSTSKPSKHLKGNAGKCHVNDLLCMNPPTFLKNFKNPCWKINKKLRCLPYFQLIGFDKSGSSDLFDRICKHPDIKRNSGVIGKETQWWPWKRYGNLLYGNFRPQTFDDYLHYFDKTIPFINSRVRNGTHYVITGDGTPMDAWDFSGWKKIPQNAGLREPKVLTPHLIKHLNNKTKFIIIMRNPIERLYSDYYFLGLAGKSPERFHVHVVESQKILNNCLKQNYSILTCLSERKSHLLWNKKARIHLGFYSVYIKLWLEIFPREQFLFFKTEEYAKDVGKHLEETFNFLEVRSITPMEMEKLSMTTRARKHETKAKKSKKPMLPQTRKLLKNMYDPYNKELADMIKTDKFLWNA